MNESNALQMAVFNDSMSNRCNILQITGHGLNYATSSCYLTCDLHAYAQQIKATRSYSQLQHTFDAVQTSARHEHTYKTKAYNMSGHQRVTARSTIVTKSSYQHYWQHWNSRSTRHKNLN